MRVDPLGNNSGLWFRARFYARVYFFTVFVSPFRFYRWRLYDPAWLQDLAREQLPEEKWLYESLARCTQASGEIPYIHFVNPRRPNKPKSDWQFETNVHLEHPEYGELILDILKGNRVGGVEFLGVLLERGNHPNPARRH